MKKKTLKEFLESKKLGKAQFVIILGEKEWKRYSLDAEGQEEMDDLSDVILLIDDVADILTGGVSDEYEARVAAGKIKKAVDVWRKAIGEY